MIGLQSGNYENSLSHFIGKSFVQVTGLEVDNEIISWIFNLFGGSKFPVFLHFVWLLSSYGRKLTWPYLGTVVCNFFCYSLYCGKNKSSLTQKFFFFQKKKSYENSWNWSISDKKIVNCKFFSWKRFDIFLSQYSIPVMVRKICTIYRNTL